MHNIFLKFLALCSILFLTSVCSAADVNQSVGFHYPYDNNYPTWSVDFSPDGNLLAGCSSLGVHVWNAQTGELVRSLEGIGGARELAFSPDGKLLAATDIDGVWERSAFSGGLVAGQVHVWNIKTWEVLHLLRVVRGDALSLEFSPDSKTLAVGSGDNKVRLWNTQNGELIRTLPGYPGRIDRIDAVAFSPDGMVLAGVEADSSIVSLWLPRTGKLIKTLNKNKQVERLSSAWSWPSKRVTFSSDGKTIVIAGNGDIHFLNIKTDQPVNMALTRQKIHGSTIAFSSDHSLFATSIAGGIRLRQVRTGQLRRTIVGEPSFAFSPNGKSLAVIGKNGIQILPAR